MNISYKFIPQGQSYEQENKDEIVLDVGGCNDGLQFDHHFPNGPKDCTAKLVFDNKGRLKELKDKLEKGSIKNVKIIVHDDPDFDCSCAAWLVKNYFNDKVVCPEGETWMVQYASLVDSGILKINREHFLVPATAMYAFDELAQKEINQKKISADKKNNWILGRAFYLLNWCAENLSGISIDNYKKIDDKSIFELMVKAHKFNMEYELLKDDREKYETEILDKNICKIITDFKVFNPEKTPKGVNALIYYQQPKSSLTKYWARSDGYIFTLIPQPCDGQWDNAIWKPPRFSGKPNRVIMSVPRDSEYNLQTLAIQLERAECEYERRILGEAAELKRTRTVFRNGYENEKWVTNNDPWYDGSSKNYTIVDSPYSLSLLPLNKIIDVAKSFTENDVTNVQIKILYPVILKAADKYKDDPWKRFFFENNSNQKDKSITKELFYDNGNTEIAYLFKSNIWEPLYNNGNTENIYMFDYAKKLLNLNGRMGEETRTETSWYQKHKSSINITEKFNYAKKLFNLDGGTSEEIKTGASWYQNQSKFIINITENNGIKEYSVINSNDLKPKSPFYPISNSEMVCFSSDIAFLILSVDIPNIPLSSDIPSILKGISSNYENDLQEFFDIKQLNINDPFYLIFVGFNRKKFINIDIGYDVFSTCSFLDETVPLTDGSDEKTLMENMLLRVNAGTVFGFSRNCSVVASISTQKPKEPQFITAYKARLNGQWIYEWILAMHQHWKMVGMKTRLGTSDISKRGNLSKLRSELVEFTANACFTQVTADPFGAELYNRWKKLLTLEDLNKEVSTQIISLEENSRSAFQSKVTFITFLLFPLTTILSILNFLRLSLGVNLISAPLGGKVLSLIAIFGASGLLSKLLLNYASKR